MSLNPLSTAIVILGTVVSAQSGQVDLGKLGPQVGQRVPDFAAPDQSGEARTLQSLFGPQGAILVFNRSADW